VPASPFHLAIPVDNLDAAVAFYTNVLGCTCGRANGRWADLNFFGHQLVCHLADGRDRAQSQVDGDAVPVPHFGVVLSMPAWRDLTRRLKKRRVAFVIEPRVRFAGQPGEQATCFIQDPSGNALEFKAFADPDRLFAT